MGKIILKLKGKEKESYMVWSTVVDCPIFWDLTREEVRQWWEEEYGRWGGFDPTMEEVEKKGLSSGGTFEELFSCNRAGKNEKRMNMKNFIAAYVDGTRPDLLP